MARSRAEEPDRGEPDDDDSGRYPVVGHDPLRIAPDDPPQIRRDHAGRLLFLRGSQLLYFGERRGFGGDGEHAPLRILRTRVNRAGYSPFFASITGTALVGARQRHGG